MFFVRCKSFLVFFLKFRVYCIFFLDENDMERNSDYVIKITGDF